MAQQTRQVAMSGGFGPVDGSWVPSSGTVPDCLATGGDGLIATAAGGSNGRWPLGSLFAIPGSATVNFFRIAITARNDDSGPSTLNAFIREGSTSHYGPGGNQTVAGAGWATINFDWTLDPRTGSAWTPAGANSVQGVGLDPGDFTPPIDVDHLVVIVDYTDGDATLVALVGVASAAGGSTSMQGAGIFAVTAGSASAAGGSAAFAGQGVLTATAGTATASGGSISMTGAATFAVSVGAASAAGGTVVMSAGSPAAMVALTGAATAAGGTATLTGAGVLAVTSAAVTASGGTASMSTGGTGTFTALTGAATASGGAAAMSGQARFVATAAAATASGGTALLAVAATFLALAATATASGGVATSTGAASMAVLAGQALAAGGVAQMVVAGPPPDSTPADLTIHTGPASYTRIIPGPATRRTIHPGRTL